MLCHVDVGTSALGQGLHNASSGRSPMLIFAGLAPYTLHGEQLLGSRSEHVQWYQDVPNQGAIVQPYVRYSNEIKSHEHVKSLVHRALLMASSGSPGPSYLTATREVLAAPSNETALTRTSQVLPSCRMGGLPTDGIRLIADALLFAERPLVLTGYLGRNHTAVHRLVELTNLLKGLKVMDTEFREMSFPADRPAWITPSTGGLAAIKEADVILVLDCDVPWIPTKVTPHHAARIFHIDLDPRKEKMQLFDIQSEASFTAECSIALSQIHEHISLHELLSHRQAIHQENAQKVMDAHVLKLELLNLRVMPRIDGSISAHQLFAALRRLLPKDTTYMHDAVTNSLAFHEQIQSTLPGTSFSKGGSGLGWAGGAAIGAKLALSNYDISDRPHPTPRSDDHDETPPENLVCAVTGDGAFIFGAPTATYFAQYRLNTPFITVVVNNGGWKATRQSLKDVHPEGIAAGMTDGEIGVDLSGDGPDYVGVAVAASNGSMWGRRVVFGEDLDDAVMEARDVVVKEGRGAILEVVVC